MPADQINFCFLLKVQTFSKNQSPFSHAVTMMSVSHCFYQIFTSILI